MEAFDVILTAMSSLIMLIAIHVSVFALVRWMYPTPLPVPSLPPPPPPPPPFTQPVEVQQVVNVPTYEKPLSAEVPRTEGLPNTAANASSPATERPAWLVAVDPKTLDK